MSSRSVWALRVGFWTLLGACCLAVAALAAPARTAEPAKPAWLLGQAYKIPSEYTNQESGYFSIVEGHNGRIYVGARGGHLHRGTVGRGARQAPPVDHQSGVAGLEDLLDRALHAGPHREEGLERSSNLVAPGGLSTGLGGKDCLGLVELEHALEVSLREQLGEACDRGLGRCHHDLQLV